MFMGTPDFAVPTLRRLAVWPRGSLVAVYTQPDRPAGRGHKLSMPPVKSAALELGLPVEQPESFKDPAAVARLAAYAPDVLVVAAYGLLLPPSVLDLTRLAPLNVHASLLPRWRGAAPIQRAIMEDWQPDARTGVSIMRVVRQLDAGPVYASASLPLNDHTAGSLHDALAQLGADLLPQVLDARWKAAPQRRNRMPAASPTPPKWANRIPSLPGTARRCRCTPISAGSRPGPARA